MKNDQNRFRYGTVCEGVPRGTAVPTVLGNTAGGGLMPMLVLAVDRGVRANVVSDFVTRYGFVSRHETARAADSQARWSLEPDGRVTFQLLCEESAARIAFPSDPRIHHWVSVARLSGGTVSMVVAAGLPSADLPVILRRIGPRGGSYWHLSVGCIPL